MRYLVLLYGDESEAPEPGTPEFDADLAGYATFDELAGKAVVAGEALHDNASCRTVRHDGGTVRVTDGPFAEPLFASGDAFACGSGLRRDQASRSAAPWRTAHEVRWFDQGGRRSAGPGTTRYLATIHGPETKADHPDTVAWDEGAAEHQRFVAEAAGSVIAEARSSRWPQRRPSGCATANCW